MLSKTHNFKPQNREEADRARFPSRMKVQSLYHDRTDRAPAEPQIY